VQEIYALVYLPIGLPRVGPVIPHKGWNPGVGPDLNMTNSSYPRGHRCQPE